MKKIGRNDPCPCGSGIKYKKCHMNIKQRDEHITIGHKDKFCGIKREDNGRILIQDLTGKWIEPDSISSQTSYMRQSGKEKVLNRVPGIAVNLILQDLARNYDRVWGIDTNTRIIGNHSISVSAVIETYFKEDVSKPSVTMSFRNFCFFFFRNCPSTLEEKHAWTRLVNKIASMPEYDRRRKMAIITDHDMGKHASINKRELPLVPNTDLYLPEKFELIYASADQGKENVLNRIIASCDKEATILLRALESDSVCRPFGVEKTLNSIREFNK